MVAEALRERRCAVLALTQGGCLLGERLAGLLEGDFFACKGRLAEVVAQAWQEYREIVCVMAAGIVVRTVAPLLQDKYHDPALVVCDEQGKFAISLISGHLGGANQLAERVAAALGGQAVLTTASDVLGLTALDLWCRELGLIVADTASFTRAMGKLVDQGALTVASAYPLPPLPPDLLAVPDQEAADLRITPRTDGPAGTALLHPRSLVFGIGCNRGTPATAIARAVAATCAHHQLAPQAIARLASIDLKQDEQGLLEFARKQGLALDFFPSDQLNQVKGVDSSPTVLRVTGAKAVAEPAALLSAGAGSTLLIKKMKWTDVTTAVAEIADPLARPTPPQERKSRTMTTAEKKSTGSLVVAGLGPGAIDLMAPRARTALEQAEIVVGYRTYLDLVRDCIPPGTEVLSSAMMQEIDRCRKALELAEAGRRVVLVCGGDPGIYAMAGLVFELARSMESTVAIDIIPGIAALNSCAAILGAPLMHDFAAISLSDLMTPWEMIERRLAAVAPADFVVVIYNPKSKKRTDQIVRAREILLAHRSPDTPVGIVSGATREHETVRLTTLGTMLDEEIGMQTTVIVGNSQTFVWREKMITPRGYGKKYGL